MWWGFLRRVLWHERHRPITDIVLCFNHVGKGFIIMSNISLIVGAQISGVVEAVNQLGGISAPPQPVSASVDNPAIATVTADPATNDGFIIAGIAEGTATITFVCGQFSTTATVTVAPDAITGIEFVPSTAGFVPIPAAPAT